MMKKILFLFGLLVCLAGMPLTAFADNKTAKQTYETAISDNWKTMLKNSIALDTINAENNTHLLEWQDVKNPSDEAVKLVDKIQKLQAEQAALEARLEEKMERWVYLNDLAEQIAAEKA